MWIALLIRVDCRREASCTFLAQHQTKLHQGFAGNAVKSQTHNTYTTHTNTQRQIHKYTDTHDTKLHPGFAAMLKSETDKPGLSILDDNVDNAVPTKNCLLDLWRYVWLLSIDERTFKLVQTMLSKTKVGPILDSFLFFWTNLEVVNFFLERTILGQNRCVVFHLKMYN